MAMPSYISWTGHGSSCSEPPGVFTGATMHLFGLTAKRATMQALADKFLKPVARNKFAYDAFLDNALLTVADIKRGTTAVEAVGWLPGGECALWIPLIETRKPTLFHPVPSLRLVILRVGDRADESDGWDEAMIPDSIIRGTSGWKPRSAGEGVDPGKFAPH